MKSTGPPPSTKRTVSFGALRGKVCIARDFDAPLPPALAAAFEGVEAGKTGTLPTSVSRRERLLDGATFRAAMGLSRRALARAITTHAVFCVEVGGTDFYPAFYTEPRIPRRSLFAVSRRLGDLSTGAKLQFWLTPKGSLGRITPLTALARGRLADVLRTADGVAGKDAYERDADEPASPCTHARGKDMDIALSLSMPDAADVEFEPAMLDAVSRPREPS